MSAYTVITNWHSFKNVAFLDNLNYSKKEHYLKITLIDKIAVTEEVAINLEFDSVLSFRFRNESYTAKTVEEMKYFGLISKERETFFEVKKSEYLQWFSSECYVPPDDWFGIDKVKHFLILTNDDCIDVLTTQEPIRFRTE
jgi:hypothetical protein